MKNEDQNETLHPWIAPELEARLTALVLGEASDFEREELERLIAGQPELGLYRKRLEAVNRMLHQVACGESEPAGEGQWKLSPEKRAVVIRQIGGGAVNAVGIRTAERKDPRGIRASEHVGTFFKDRRLYRRRGLDSIFRDPCIQKYGLQHEAGLPNRPV